MKSAAYRVCLWQDQVKHVEQLADSRPAALVALMMQELRHRHLGVQPGHPNPMLPASTQHSRLQVGVLQG